MMGRRIVFTNGYPDAEAHASWLVSELSRVRRESRSNHPAWNNDSKRAGFAQRAKEIENELSNMTVCVPADSE